MRWVLPARLARALFSWIMVKSSKIPFQSSSLLLRRASALSVFCNCSRIKVEREHKHVKSQTWNHGSDRQRCCLHRDDNVRLRAADTVAPLRGNKEQETAGMPVSSLLFDLVPQSEDWPD